jgi:hypothetical protein
MFVCTFDTLLFVAGNAAWGLLAVNGWAVTGFAAICPAFSRLDGCCGGGSGRWVAMLSSTICVGVLDLLFTEDEASGWAASSG